MRHKFRLTVTVHLVDNPTLPSDPNDCAYCGAMGAEDVRSYVREAVAHWGGQYHRDDPMFPTNILSVKVT